MQGNLSANSQPLNDAASQPSPFVFTRLLSGDQKLAAKGQASFVLALTADERTKSKHYFEAQRESTDSSHADEIYGNHDPGKAQMQGVYLGLSRGTVLHHGDRLTTDQGNAVLRLVAKPEPVMTAIAPSPLDLLKAAYHLGNRHVALEVSIHYLRFSPDPVLKNMVEQMGLHVSEENMPFHPEAGAYASHPKHSHHGH